VLSCPRCGLAQLSVVVRPDLLYSSYAYVTSKSQTMLAHFEALWADISEGRQIKSVLEIGSNDGTLLYWLARKPAIQEVYGVEPAANLCLVAYEKNIPTFVGRFSRVAAEKIRSGAPASGYDLIIARHVLCHVDDWQDFFAGVELLSGPQTVVCIENPYLPDILASNSFDQIYHEHLSYLSVRAMEAALENTELEVKSVKRYPIHGGAIVLLVQRKESLAPLDFSVREFEMNEHIGPDAWAHFGLRVDELRGDLNVKLRKFRSQGKTVAALGASAKSTVWINHCGLTKKDIAWVADNTPGKQGCLVPGSDIEVCDEGAILRELPDYLVIFCWNWKAAVLEKTQLARSKGVKLIFPIPQIEIV